MENQGHLVPAPLVGRFLAAVRGGKPAEASGLPSLGVHLQHMMSPSARAKLGMGPHHTGVLISHVDCTGSAAGLLRERDVVLEIDGVPIANDGTCRLFGIRVALIAVLHRRFLGDTVQLRILRDGQEASVDVLLKRASALVPRGQFDCAAPFFIVGGLVFQARTGCGGFELKKPCGGRLRAAAPRARAQRSPNPCAPCPPPSQPLSYEFLSTWSELKDAPSHLLHWYTDGLPSATRSEVVVLTQLLADEANVGYDSDSVGFDVVNAVNGVPVPSMAALVQARRGCGGLRRVAAAGCCGVWVGVWGWGLRGVRPPQRLPCPGADPALAAAGGAAAAARGEVPGVFAAAGGGAAGAHPEQRRRERRGRPHPGSLQGAQPLLLPLPAPAVSGGWPDDRPESRPSFSAGPLFHTS